MCAIIVFDIAFHLLRIITCHVFATAALHAAIMNTPTLLAPCNCKIGRSHLTFAPLCGKGGDPSARPSHLVFSMRTLFARMRRRRRRALRVQHLITMPRSRVVHKARGSYTSSPWVKYLNVRDDDDLNKPNSFDAKVFRTRFRVPWKFYYDKLLPWTEARFPRKVDALQRPGVPTEFKLLAVLRMLGRALHFDDVAELADCGFKGEVLRVLFCFVASLD